MTHRLLLILATLAAYANSIRCGLPFDSVVLIRDDARVQSWSWHNLFLVLTQNYWGKRINGGIYRPFVTFSYLLQHGQPDWAFHVVNLGLHVGAVMLAYSLLRRLVPAVAFWACLIWAVHPLNTEAVTNVAGRADVMATCCVLGVFLIYHAQEMWYPRTALVALFAVSLVGTFSKETAVVALPLCLLYDWFSRTKVDRAAIVAIALPMVLMAWVRWYLGFNRGFNRTFLDNPIMGADFLTGKLTAFKVLVKMIGLWLWPHVLSADYSYNQVPLVHLAERWPPIFGGVLIGLVIVSVEDMFHPRPIFSRDWICWFFAILVCLLPTSNLLMPIGSIMAERFLYLPGLGLAVLVAYLSLRIPYQCGSIVLVLILLSLSARTIYRNRDYRDELTFWIATLEASPTSWKPHSQIAALAAQRGLNDLAADEADKVLALLKDLPDEQSSYAVWSEMFPYYQAVNDKGKMKLVADKVALMFNAAYQKQHKSD